MREHSFSPNNVQTVYLYLKDILFYDENSIICPSTANKKSKTKKHKNIANKQRIITMKNMQLRSVQKRDLKDNPLRHQIEMQMAVLLKL